MSPRATRKKAENPDSNVLSNKFNPFTAMMSFKTTNNEMRNLKSLSLFVFCFALACEGIFIKTRSTESR